MIVARFIRRTSLKVQLLKFIEIDNEHKVQPINRAAQNDRNTNEESCNSLSSERWRERERKNVTTLLAIKMILTFVYWHGRSARTR